MQAEVKAGGAAGHRALKGGTPHPESAPLHTSLACTLGTPASSAVT